MSDLTNKVISSNFQRLLQISESGAIADGTGSAFGIKLGSSGNVGINHDPVDNFSLFVDGAISASTLNVNPGTIFLGDITMSQNVDGGITFRDSGSNELGAFQGDGYFILSSSLETGGAGRPLFNLTQQVGSTQNKNVMQVDLYSFKHYQNGGSPQWRFGVQPSGSSQQGDFFINGQNGAFTVNPSPTGLNKPSFYVTQSNLRIGLGMYPNNTDKVSVDGSIFASGSDVGHITASGNLLVEGDAVIKGNLTFGDSTSDNISFGAEVSSSILPDSDGTFTLGNSSKRWKEVHADLVQVQGNVSGSGNLTVAGDINANGNIVGDNLTSISGIQHITASGDISADKLTIGETITASLNGDISTGGNSNFGGNDSKNHIFKGNITSSGNIKSNKGNFTNLPTNPNATNVLTGDLYTLSGSQLPFDTGSLGSSQRALFNSVSSSKFVLIK